MPPRHKYKVLHWKKPGDILSKCIDKCSQLTCTALKRSCLLWAPKTLRLYGKTLTMVEGGGGGGAEIPKASSRASRSIAKTKTIEGVKVHDKEQ